MIRLSPRHFSLLLAPLVGLSTLACADYDPAPEAELKQPAEGIWTKNSPLVLEFTEPIEPQTLFVTVWPNDLDREGELRPEVVAIIDACTLATAPCGDFEMVIDDARRVVTITVNDTFDDREGVPLIMEVHKDLEDGKGRRRKVKTWFDFQINPTAQGAPVDIQMETGVFSLTANLKVLPVWLRLYVDMAIDKDTGEFVAIGSLARLDNTLGLDPNYAQPDGFQEILDSESWAIVMTGFVVEQAEGDYFMQSDPFDVNISVLGTIPVILNQFQVQGTIVPATVAGERDTMSGTMSTSSGSFDPGTGVIEVDAITTSWEGASFHADEIPVGIPRVCEDNPCAEMNAGGGDCQLSDPWEPGSVCP